MGEDIDINEISNHVKKLLEDTKDSKKSILTDSELMTWEEISKDDIFEVVNKTDSIKENTTKMDVNLSTRICDVCKKTIDLEENLSGLVVHDSHFLCEECCQDSSKNKLDVWTNSKMANPGDLKPIALWLMNEKNKGRLF